MEEKERGGSLREERGRRSVCARRRGGWGKRSPWKSRGESAPLPLPPLPADPPRSSARGSRRFPRGKAAVVRASASGDRCTPHVEAISARGRKKEKLYIYIYIYIFLYIEYIYIYIYIYIYTHNTHRYIKREGKRKGEKEREDEAGSARGRTRESRSRKRRARVVTRDSAASRSSQFDTSSYHSFGAQSQ